MSRKKRVPGVIISGLLVLLVSCVFGVSQEKKRPNEETERPVYVEPRRKETLLDGTFNLVWSKLSPDFRRVVKGVPYSATAITEHTQTLSDGNQIIWKGEIIYHRDSEGRIRTEQKLNTIGNWTAAGDTPQLIMINDPVAGRSYTLDSRARTVRVEIYVVSAAAAIEKQKRESEARQAKSMMTEAEKAPTKTAAKAEKADTAMKPVPATKPNRKEETNQRIKKQSLGIQVIEGVQAEGTRSTLTIPAGEIGNTLPIQVIDENWYSPDLQVRVMSKHSDPRSGETVFRLININRSEPSRALFEVPADYTVTSSKPSGGEPVWKPKPKKRERVDEER